MHDEKPNRKPEEDTTEAIDRFEDLIGWLERASMEELREERRRREREQDERGRDGPDGSRTP